jgi:hypothetical protein
VKVVVQRTRERGKKVDRPRSPPASGALIRDITDVIRIHALGVAQLVLIDITDEPALARISSLRTRLVLLAPSKLRFQR